MSMKRVKILMAIMVFSCITIKAQDAHFSRFDHIPIYINPALTGVFNGDQRAIVNYRNQWASVASPFKTYSLSFDTRFRNKSSKNFQFGAGVFIYKDVAGDLDFGITSASGLLSGILKINSNQKLIVGVRGAFEQRSLDNSKMIWDAQYDGTGYNSSLSSGELTNYGSPFNFFDMGTGVSWVYGKSQSTISSNDEFYAIVGASLNHILKPDLKYFQQENLYRNLNIYSKVNIGISNSPYSVVPSLLVQFQGPNTEIIGGGMFRYRIKEESKYTGFFKESAVSVGAYVRYKDAIIPSLSYEISNWQLVFSYDYNVSDLQNVSRGNGGFEVSLIFINPNPFKYGKGSAKFI